MDDIEKLSAIEFIAGILHTERRLAEFKKGGPTLAEYQKTIEEIAKNEEHILKALQLITEPLLDVIEGARRRIESMEPPQQNGQIEKSQGR